MSKSTIDGFGLTEFDLEPPNRDPNISEDITQTLSRLIGWDRVRRVWRGLSTDIDGRLIISMSGIQLNTARHGVVLHGAAAYRVMPANENRRLVSLFNNTTGTLYLGFDSTVTVANGFPLASGAIMTDNMYTGEWWAINPAVAGDIRWMEF